MTQEQVIAQIKYKISNICLNKLLNESKINKNEFEKTDQFLRRKYNIDFSKV